MRGTHIVVDVSNIQNNEILKYESTILPLLDEISEQFNLNVVSKSSHQFQPFGVTGVYILSESHLSVHTFVEENKVAMDLYTCTKFEKVEEFIAYLHNYFDDCEIAYQVIDRL